MNEKKFLDYDGVKYLWSKVNMQDYPNNEMLITVISAIDETKADTNYVDQIVATKQDAITGTTGQFVVIGENGKPEAKTIPYAEEVAF